MKTISILTISIFLLNSCIVEEEDIFFDPGEPKNGDVSFTIDGQKYSSPHNWYITLLNSNNPLNNVSELIIKDTLGFDFSHIMLLNNSGICGIVIPVEYKDPKYHPIYLRPGIMVTKNKNIYHDFDSQFERAYFELSVAPGIGYSLGYKEPSLRLLFNLSDAGNKVYFPDFRLAYTFLNSIN